jgi:phosphoribosylanthranilate isomerase
MPVTVKICGLSTRDAVEAAVAGGAAFVGFVFYGPSPRNVTPAQAAALCTVVPPGIGRVGLFVDADDATIAAALAAAPLDLLQFHGSETPARVAAVKRRFGRKVMKAIPVADAADLAAADAYSKTADWLIFDARPPRRADALPGGNGLAFDWQLLGGRSWQLSWMLSGGLAADNLAEAVRLSGAKFIDVSSGVESAPGRKDAPKIAAFLAAARALAP